ncbi:leucyl aminopeptidase family protein [Rhizobium terrae]|uniref:leucyl aminopeptidase family protein n=1 Tax=Rhizobium terrae TaxID=2171756 RepID=UPI000E3BF875|nr:leucyl aminopeptidase family protein [Rhizobium terrae]
MEKSVPLVCITESSPLLQEQDAKTSRWAFSHGFCGQKGRLLSVPDDEGAIAAWLFGMGKASETRDMATGLAAMALPEGIYTLEGGFEDPTAAALGFILGSYRFSSYKIFPRSPQLAFNSDIDRPEVDRLAQAAFIARDLINLPANDLGPEKLDAAIRRFAYDHEMSVTSFVGDELLVHGFPLVHTVGRASAEAPRLLDLTWGHASDPKVTVVGKGVTFDTGGLNLKSFDHMESMKCDMAGAANALGIAHAVISANLPVRLRVIVPIVESAVASSAFRPGDIIRARNGITVEIGFTDAEGRLILADALAYADEEAPVALIDLATLTGAAGVALGSDIAALYCTDDGFAASLCEQGTRWDDPVWRMPLWSDYEFMLSSEPADCNNFKSESFAGSITAALFLRKFVARSHLWAHFDIPGWTKRQTNSRPVGGTDHAIRAIYMALKHRKFYRNIP